MKRMSVLLMVMVLIAAFGCSKKSTPGGPGATPSAQQSGDENVQTFTLQMPMTAADIGQGDTQEVTIGIDRGGKFDQDVTLMFNDLPNGVTIEPAAPVLRRGEDNVKVMVRVAPTATAGNYTARVVGRPATGPEAMGELKLDIHAK